MERGRRAAGRTVRGCVASLALALCGCTDGRARSEDPLAASGMPAQPAAGGRCVGLATEEPPGAELFEITGPDCLGASAGPPGVAGNPAEPVTAFDATHNYVSFFSTSEPHDVLVTRFDGRACSPAVRANREPGDDRSHDAPSVFVDGLGYVYVSYFASHYRNGPRPALRRTRRPNDLSEWEPETRARLWNSGELNGFRLDDGAVLLVGSNFSTRIDVIEPGGAWRWPAARQVVAQDQGSRGTACGSRGNRFTKAVVEEGWSLPDGGQALVATWGWGGGFSDDARPAGLCPDIRDYAADSHEVFFAFSEDGGLTWQDKDRRKRVAAPLCPTEEACGRTHGIAYDDPAFRVTRSRQRAHRAIWAHDDATVYIAFERSQWCDAGDDCAAPSATRPGALTLLRFRPGGPVEERAVDPAPHSYTAGVRKAGDSLFVWSKNEQDQMVYEYRSDDDGATWSRTAIVRGNRVHGTTRIPCLNSIRLAITAGGRPLAVYHYRRTLGPGKHGERSKDDATS